MDKVDIQNIVIIDLELGIQAMKKNYGDSIFINDILNIEGRYNNLIRNKSFGVIQEGDILTEENRIRNSVLKLLDLITGNEAIINKVFTYSYLNIKRLTRFIGIVKGIGVYVNDEKVCVIDAGERKRIRIQCGKNKIAVSANMQWSDTLTFITKENEQVEVEVGWTMGGLYVKL